MVTSNKISCMIIYQLDFNPNNRDGRNKDQTDETLILLQFIKDSNLSLKTEVTMTKIQAQFMKLFIKSGQCTNI